jgi:hypothetical protein
MIPCPKCNAIGHRVIASRPAVKEPAKRRRCVCNTCGFRFNTKEQLDTGKPKPLPVAPQPPESIWLRRLGRLEVSLAKLQELLHENTAAARLVSQSGPQPDADRSQSAVDPWVLVEILELPLRAHNALKRSGVDTVDQLLALSPDDLMHIRNFGAASLADVTQALDQLGLKLRL